MLRTLISALLVFVTFDAATARAAGDYFDVAYPPSTEPGELQFGVVYRVWIPPHVKTLRGVIVHQHGCGTGACKGGETAAYDLHWQALAKKWDCALLGPAYQQPEGANCRLWCDPRNGSAKTFFRALDDLAVKSKHPEMKSVPWCLWGHSGGGFWASLMQAMYPERIVAVWLRSGTAYGYWESGEIEKPELTPAVYAVPAALNPGVKEKGKNAWEYSVAMFEAYRKQNSPITFAPDPRTGHECGDSRYLAIPYFDAWLNERLPPKGAADQVLRPGPKETYLVKIGDFDMIWHSAEAGFMPSIEMTELWLQYVEKGATDDKTPPAAPTNVVAVKAADNKIEITWDCAADFESGLKQFIIERDGKPLAQVPENPVGKFGRPLFQGMSYHDTPEAPLAEMKYLDAAGDPAKPPTYRVVAVNGVGLLSEPSAEAKPIDARAEVKIKLP